MIFGILVSRAFQRCNMNDFATIPKVNFCCHYRVKLIIMKPEMYQGYASLGQSLCVFWAKGYVVLMLSVT